uniref:Uncharacterized protein n=1 Tax=Arion vulgaris TaxID=1028688 RepID=A0A0B7A572_9EUPU
MKRRRRRRRMNESMNQTKNQSLKNVLFTFNVSRTFLCVCFCVCPWNTTPSSVKPFCNFLESVSVFVIERQRV